MVWNSIKKLFDRDTGPVPLGGVDLGLDLLRLLGRPGNIALSPASVRTALGMALLGARGQTAQDLVLGLRLGGQSRSDFEAAERVRLARYQEPSRPYALLSANALFAAPSLRRRPSADSRLQEGYRAEVRELPFDTDPAAAVREINRWVSGATRGLIPEIATPGNVRAQTRLVLANALYFKAEWRIKFTPDSTHLAPFVLPQGERVQVSMMQQTASHRALVGPEVELLELAYRGDDLAMTFVLPPRGVALADFEARLEESTLGGWLSRLKEQRIKVTLPKFTVDTDALALGEPLGSMGVRAPFDATVADFGDLFEEPVVIDQVLHRARVAVNEEGTEAAAATALFAELSAAREKLLIFTIDRPFLFLLRDLRDGTALFLGRVTDPR